jgi:hypothetical protein
MPLRGHCQRDLQVENTCTNLSFVNGNLEEDDAALLFFRGHRQRGIQIQYMQGLVTSRGYVTFNTLPIYRF